MLIPRECSKPQNECGRWPSRRGLIITQAALERQASQTPPLERRWRARVSLSRLPHKELHIATNLAVDPDLLDRAVEVSGERTKKAAVTEALQAFIARREQRRIADLFWKLEWYDSYRHKAQRSRRA